MAEPPRPAGASSPPLPSASENASFEEALDRLEAVVDRLEHGELELEAALAAFEEGVALSRRCAERLDAAERRIQVLESTGGEIALRPFETGSEGAG